MARRVKINSNPNTIPAPGKRNPTEQDIYEQELRDVRQDKLGSKESSSKKTIKIDSNPKPGKTRIGPLARGGAGGGGFLDNLK